VSHRPLVLLSGLTVGDYLLWNWSLAGNHDVLALVSGLTLTPLAVVCVVLLALTGVRLAARLARRPTRRSAPGGAEHTARTCHRGAPSGMSLSEPPTKTTSGGTSTSKLAA